MLERQNLIAALAETREDQLLLARAWDRLGAGETRNIPAATGFLTGREQLLVTKLCARAGLRPPVFFGGYDGAERAVAVYIPDYLEPEDYLRGEEGPVAALRATWSRFDRLSHRDFLGSLMGQGVKREVLGDLLPGEGSCDILVLRDMAGYLCRELRQVGRATVETVEIGLRELAVPERKVQRIADTVASLRLDSILASGFRQGRSKAAELIRAGRVELRHVPTLKPDAIVGEGDVISARGLGKLRVAEVRGQTKKGRVSVVLERYL